MLLFNVIPNWRQSFVFLNMLIEVSAHIPNMVCIAQTTLVIVNNALLVNDSWLLFFWLDLVSNLTACIHGGNINPILQPSSPSCLHMELADLWSLNDNTILTGVSFTLRARVEIGSPETFLVTKLLMVDCINCVIIPVPNAYIFHSFFLQLEDDLREVETSFFTAGFYSEMFFKKNTYKN